MGGFHAARGDVEQSNKHSTKKWVSFDAFCGIYSKSPCESSITQRSIWSDDSGLTGTYVRVNQIGLLFDAPRNNGKAFLRR